jgi:hypothetical protein
MVVAATVVMATMAAMIIEIEIEVRREQQPPRIRVESRRPVGGVVWSIGIGIGIVIGVRVGVMVIAHTTATGE